MKVGDLDAAPLLSPLRRHVHRCQRREGGAAESQAKRKTPGGSLGQAQRHGGYGMSEGNLSNMVEGVVSSPPYEEGLGHGGKPTTPPKGDRPGGSCNSMEAGYGGSEGQGRQMAGQTFWEASRLILEQCHAVLRPTQSQHST